MLTLILVLHKGKPLSELQVQIESEDERED